MSVNPFKPERAIIREIIPETYDTTTYSLEFLNPQKRQEYSFLPGQFNMLSVIGVGEAPISVSSDPEEQEKLGLFQHTIRHVGDVTNALKRYNVGDSLFIRGPYGNGWPMDLLLGHNVLIIAGGIGLAPLRPVIKHIINHREDYGLVEVLYGARTPKDHLFTREFEEWQQKIDFRITCDIADESWQGAVGVVTTLCYEMKSKPDYTIALTCGPEIMMQFAVKDLLERGFEPDQIYVSLERRMECGINKCGKCQIGPKFVCKDGPVFAFAELLTIPEDILGGVGR